MKIRLKRGMGIGGWLTNYKRFHVLNDAQKQCLTIGDYEHFENYISEKDVKYIASLGFDHVRVCFDQIVLEERPGVYRENVLKLLDRFIGWTEKYSLTLVLNLHKAIGNYCDVQDAQNLFESAQLRENFVRFWLMLEKRYASKQVCFELLNEVKDVAPALWNSLAAETVAAIRALNRNRVVIVGSTCWNSVRTLNKVQVFDDENVYYTFHMYEPFEFTHQRGVLQQPTCFYNREMPYPCDAERYRDYRRTVYGDMNAYKDYDTIDKRFLYDFMAPAQEFLRAHPGKVLWCGEFGTIMHARQQWRENWMRDVIAFLKENGIGYCVWNFMSAPYDGNKFSLVDEKTRKIASKKMLKIIKGYV